VALSLTQKGLVPVETRPQAVDKDGGHDTVPPAPELVTRSVRVYCAKVKQGNTTARARTASVLMDTLILFFLSDVLCAEALVADGFAVLASREGPGQGAKLFFPEAINRNASFKVAACSATDVTLKSTGC